MRGQQFQGSHSTQPGALQKALRIGMRKEGGGWVVADLGTLRYEGLAGEGHRQEEDDRSQEGRRQVLLVGRGWSGK